MSQNVLKQHEQKVSLVEISASDSKLGQLASTFRVQAS